MHVPQTISLRDVAIGVKWGSFADVHNRVEREPGDEILKWRDPVPNQARRGKEQERMATARVVYS